MGLRPCRPLGMRGVHGLSLGAEVQLLPVSLSLSAADRLDIIRRSAYFFSRWPMLLWPAYLMAAGALPPALASDWAAAAEHLPAALVNPTLASLSPLAISSFALLLPVPPLSTSIRVFCSACHCSSLCCVTSCLTIRSGAATT